ncbi:Gfo/Idh/MocA family oxidoreductase [Pseudoxanthomonas sp.]|uniref:Gfo/Idh/MocA family protein n=1 Tax=Pseudoxanthomonas sp. TaxID=1871049 RepID=UPI0028C3D63F|nr:Gfo/Idh/MocA family oxidoreductase [Pseudoxanthomonas sp.]
MRIAIIGCGFVADLYMETLRKHADLELVGVWDRDPVRLALFCRTYDVPAWPSLESLLQDSTVETVLNLTNPHSHYPVSRACLEAGKHVYSEKPLAMDVNDARDLVERANAYGLRLSGAPSRLLGRPAQTAWKLLRDGAIGCPYLVYAEMDDGLLHRMSVRRWRGLSGAPWPYKDELRVGNTLEHAGYVLTWLAAMFGPAQSVTAFGARAVLEKNLDVPLKEQAADVTFAGIEYASGMIARLTCSIVASHDHAFRVFGEDGILTVDDVWQPESPVRIRKRLNFRGRTMESPFAAKQRLLGDDEAKRLSKGRRKVDFCLGPVELARSLRDGRPSRLSPELTLHVAELSLAITQAMEGEARVRIHSRFDTIDPMPWAR